MAALTSGRITPQRMGGTNYPERVVVGVKAATTLQIGGLVFVDSTNRALPATVAVGQKCPGVLLDQPGAMPGQPVVGSAVDRAVQVQVTPGEFAFDQDASILATSQYGIPIYAVDDHTVTLTATGASQIGYLTGITTSTDPQIGAQVWVMVGRGLAP